MIYLLLFFGVYFVLKGILLTQGRTVPRGVREKIRDDETLRGWCYGTGAVHILWGFSAIALWFANAFIPYALYALVVFLASCIASVILMLRTTRQYSNKR